MISVLFAAKPEAWAEYAPHLRKALDATGLRYTLSTDIAPGEVDYIIYAPNEALQDFAPFVKTKAVLSLWAGVEQIVGNATLTQPICRMVDPGLTEGMVEWVTGHVLRHHLGMDAHIQGQDGMWRAVAPPLARDRKLCILGLGALGAACAAQLRSLNFEVHGWSRSLKELDGIICHSGDTGFAAALRGADIVVLLLPDTPATENMVDASALSLLDKGASVINPGRGPLIDDAALIAALDAGQVGHATLDVFRTEPLPADHPFWAHPNVTVTPHIASETRAPSSSNVIADNIRRREAGLPLLHLVDRNLGY